MPASHILASFTALVPNVDPASPVKKEMPSQSEGSKSPFPASRSTIPINVVNRLEYVPAIVRGIITHYVEPQVRARLKEPSDTLRLTEDLGLDSLTMMEIMIKVEDLLHVTVSDAELRHFRTLGDFRLFIDRAVRNAAAPVSPPLPAS